MLRRRVKRGRALAGTALLPLAVLLVVAAWRGQPSRTPATPVTLSPATPTAFPASAPTGAVAGEQAPDGASAHVRQVIDGDTIVLDDGRIIRYIGVDAPETGRGRAPECFAEQATARNRELVEGKSARLERDVSETDKYDRLLRYVFVGDLLVNEVLIREGFAATRTYPPDVRFADRFRAAATEARAAGRGLWGDACRGTARPQPSDDRDCTDFRTRAQAQVFFESQGGPAEDPHNLDQDNDGLVCESLP